MQARRAGSQTTAASTGQVDPHVNKCPDLLGARHRVERVVFHLRLCGSQGESRTSDGRRVHWIGRETVHGAHSSDDSRCEAAVLSPGEHGQVKSADSRQKHHGIAAWRRIKSENQPDARGRHTAMLMRVMQQVWDSCCAASTFLDQLTEWERRIQECEGRPSQSASHAPESIRNVIRLAAGRDCSSVFGDRFVFVRVVLCSIVCKRLE